MIEKSAQKITEFVFGDSFTNFTGTAVLHKLESGKTRIVFKTPLGIYLDWDPENHGKESQGEGVEAMLSLLDLIMTTAHRKLKEAVLKIVAENNHMFPSTEKSDHSE